MSPRIQEHVGERPSHFRRRSQHAHVRTIREDASGPGEDPIHGARDPRADCLESTRQIRSALRFHHQMQVVALDRVVDDAMTIACLQCAKA